MNDITTEDICRSITNIIEKLDLIESKIIRSIIIMDNLYDIF